MLLKLALTFLFLCSIQAKVMVSEIMFNPLQPSSGFEFIELHSNDSTATDLSKWTFSMGVNFTFPDGASIPANGYVVLSNNRAKFLFAYPSVPASRVYGDFTGKLDNKGELLEVKDASGTIQISFIFNNAWYTVADGFGPSIELICDTANPSNVLSWRPSPLLMSTDPNAQYGGSPGAQSTYYTCPAPTYIYQTPKVFFSEIMYKPYNEATLVSNHEYLEIYNGETTAVPLDNWRIVSGSTKGNAVRYIFPVGSSIPANSYMVIAKNKDMLTTLYGLTSSVVIGNYNGELPNGDALLLVDSNGMQVDYTEFNNKFPWATAADGKSSTSTQYKGNSLQRVSWTVLASKSYNWIASAGTPGAANAVSQANPDSTVTSYTVSQPLQKSQNNELWPGIPVTVSIKVTPAVSAVTLEYFTANLYATTYEASISDVTSNAVNFIAGSDTNTWTYTFPTGFAENTAIKYRIKVGTNVIAPRATDDQKWFGFFVSPVLQTSSDVYHLFILPANWDTLWKNIELGFYLDAQCCNFNPTWGDEVYSVLGYRGQLIDVRSQYQGSEFNRKSGVSEIKTWNFPGPSVPNPIRALSWKIDLPEWADIDNKETIYLLKPRDVGCSLNSWYVMMDLARQLGLPAIDLKFSRIHINGGYFMYAMDINFNSNAQVQDYIDKNYDECYWQSTEQVGFMYKAHGSACNGPAGPSNEGYLDALTCGAKTYSAAERTALSYDQLTRGYTKLSDNVLNITIGLNNIGLSFAENDAASRQWFMDNFDINYMLNYMVLVNYGGAWDDLLGNHNLYQRVTDGKWCMVPYDMDSFFGKQQPCQNASCSLYNGEQGQPVGIYQFPGGYNVLKDHFIKTFRNEINQRYVLLAKSVLSTPNVNAVFAKVMTKLNVTEYNQAAATPNSYRVECTSKMTTWAAQRNDYVLATLSSITADPALYDPVTYKLTKSLLCPTKANITVNNAVYKTTPGKPYAPYQSATASGSITVSWYGANPNGNAITSYILTRSEGTGAFTQVYSGSALTYTDSGLNEKSTYTYKVQAVNSAGNSIISDVSAAFTPGVVNNNPNPTTGGVVTGTISSQGLTTGPVITNPESTTQVGSSSQLTVFFGLIIATIAML